MRIILTTIAASVILLIANCTYDNKEDFLDGNVPCTPENVSYVNDVLPILSGKCFGCHGQGIGTSGVTLEGYSSLKNYVNNGKLTGVITHAPGFPPMPRGGSKLNACDISKIQTWIDEGAQEN